MGDDYITGKARLKELRRRLRDRERTLAQLNAVAGDGIGGAAALLAEARNAALLAPDEAPESWEAAVETLHKAANASPEEHLTRYEQSVDQVEFGRLNEEHRRLRQQLQKQQDELDAMKPLVREEGSFAREAGEQRSRLTSLQLFSSLADPCCPLCE